MRLTVSGTIPLIEHFALSFVPCAEILLRAAPRRVRRASGRGI
jgi:hypothetical protein